MKPDYLDILFLIAAAVMALGVIYQIAPARKVRSLAPAKLKRQDAPVAVRRPRNWRW